MTHSTNLPQPALWLITGASSGIGLALAEHVLEQGERVVLAARNVDAMQQVASRYPERAVVVRFDAARPEQIDGTVREIEARVGPIDVLVNNAGYGYVSAIEEGKASDVQRLFDVNFFSAAALIRAVLPGMRARRRGMIVNVSSVAGVVASAGLGYYAATKFALSGLTEALWQEVEPFGIGVMLVEPGRVRTAGRETSVKSEPLPAYADTVGAVRDWVAHGPESELIGDPARVAEVILRTVRSEAPPHRLVLGSDAMTAIKTKLETMATEYAAVEPVAGTIAFH